MGKPGHYTRVSAHRLLNEESQTKKVKLKPQCWLAGWLGHTSVIRGTSQEGLGLLGLARTPEFLCSPGQCLLKASYTFRGSQVQDRCASSLPETEHSFQLKLRFRRFAMIQELLPKNDDFQLQPSLGLEVRQ